MATARWFIVRNNEKVGPFAPVELRQLANFGLLKPAESLLMEGGSKPVEASSVPWLFPPPAAKKYSLKLLGQVRGPYLLDQIRAALTAREITLDTLVQTDASRPWVRLSELDEFRRFEATPLSPSRAELFTNTLEVEEAALHLAGKGGDVLAGLISNLLDKQRAYADSPAIVENIETTIRVLKAKREELANSAKPRPGSGSK